MSLIKDINEETPLTPGEVAGVAFLFFSLLFIGNNSSALLYIIKARATWPSNPLGHVLNNIVLPLGLAIGLLGGAQSVGRYVFLKIIRIEKAPAWGMILELAVGLVCVSYLVFLIGIFGFFYAWVLRVVAIILCGIGVVVWFRGAHGDLLKRSHGFWVAAAAGLLVYLLWNSIVRALAPPTEIDVLTYHLALPKFYLVHGHIDDISWQLYSHWPQLMEMLYSLGVACGKDGSSALLHTGICAGLVLLTYRFACKNLNSSAAAFATCLLACQPLLFGEAGVALVDGALSFFYLMACVCLWQWRSERDSRWLKPAGMMAGATAAIKLHGLILFLGLGSWFVVQLIQDDVLNRKSAGKTFLIWAVFFAGPWYLKTWVRSGNPIWPYFPGLFGGRWGVAGPARFLAPKFSLMRRIQEYHWIFLDEGALFLLGPASAAIAWFIWRHERLPSFFKLFFASAPLYFFLALSSVSVWRYMLPFFAPLALLAGSALSQMWVMNRAGKVAAVCLLTLGLSRSVRATHNNQLFALAGLRSTSRPELDYRQAYLSHALDGYDFAAAINKAIPSQGRVLLIAENRVYYIDADYMIGDPWDQGIISYDSLKGPADLRLRLAHYGITHLAITYSSNWYSDSLRNMAPRTYALIDETARRYGYEILAINQDKLYALKPLPRSYE